MKNKLGIISLASCILLGAGFFFLKDWYYFFDMQKLYEEEEYSKIIEKYSGKIEPYTLHNLGNAEYMSSNQELTKLTSALEYYSGALAQGENTESRYNYEFVKKLIEEKEQEMQEEQQQDEKDSQQNEENEDSNDNNSKESSDKPESSEKSQNGESSDGDEEGKQDSQNGQSAQRGEEYKLGEQDAIGEISSQEQEALEREIENLKREQIYNQKFYGKKPQETNFGSIFDDFFGNSIDRGGEKDW